MTIFAFSGVTAAADPGAACAALAPHQQQMPAGGTNQPKFNFDALQEQPESGQTHTGQQLTCTSNPTDIMHMSGSNGMSEQQHAHVLYHSASCSTHVCCLCLGSQSIQEVQILPCSMVVTAAHLAAGVLPAARSRGGRQVKTRKPANFKRPAFARRASGSKRAIGIPDLIRPVETLTEHAMFVELLPAFTKGSRVEWYAMAREWNLRVLYSHKLQRPLDASLKHEKRLKEFADAYTKSVRKRESLMTFAYPQALQPVSNLIPTQAWPLPTGAAPQPNGVALPQIGLVAQAAGAAAQPPVHAQPNGIALPQIGLVAQQAALAPMFQPQPAANAHHNHPLQQPNARTIGVSGLGGRTASKPQNRQGGPGKPKTCKVCSYVQKCDVRMAGHHVVECKYCAPCFKRNKEVVLKANHHCPYSKK